MRETIKILVAIALIAISIILLIAYVVVDVFSGKFEYVDFDGNYGNASMCYSSHGGFVCENEAGEKIMVKRYRRVEG